MILFSLGTHSQEFSRMAKAADDYAAITDEKVIVQTGYTKYDFKHVKEHFDFCPKDKMEQFMDEAGILVLQGGWGGICEAVDKGKRVIVLPRRNGVEHVHDQSQVAKKMDELGCVICCMDEDDLPEMIEKARTYKFKPLHRGSARIVADTLNEWFHTNNKTQTIMDIKILVATHKKAHMPLDEMYLPIRVGNALAKDDTGYKGDDTGENISEKNPCFCELTALYWGWKNVKADYIGLAHYRRHFSCRKGKWKYSLILTKEEANNFLVKADVVLPQKRKYFIESLSSHYKHTHDFEHLELTREIIRKQCPEYVPVFDKVMKRTSAHMFNMMIMKYEVLDSYCSWLFPILFALEKEIDMTHMTAFDARLFGRVSEMLLDVWLKQNGIKYVETGFVQIGDENWGKKIKGFLSAKFAGRKYDRSK